MKTVKTLLVSGLLIAAMALSGCGGSEKKPEAKPAAGPQTIKLAHVVNEKDGFHIAALKFKELVEARTKGAVKVEVFPNASLGDERTLIEGMQIGTIAMGVITNGPVANFLPEIAAFEMPFMFATPEEAYKVLDGPVGKKVLDKLDAINLKGLAYAERGFRNLTNSKKVVKTPADMAGLKIRVMENPVYIDTFKTLGTNAVPMAWTEALTALQQGTIDGQENPINVIYSFKLNETQKYLTMTKHSYAPALFLMSKKVFGSFNKETQDILVKAAQEAAVHERKWNAEQMAEQLKALKEKGMQITEPDTAAFQAAVKPVYDKYGPKFGTLLEDINKAKK
ncbi:MAG: DctP family TRAP transporter solute-binding subunit [Veillonellaceae bacterium]|nr:DctP family TRAP transporter solute-binding subunit [Veillonellaceae bacterium]